jgi:hypothetical protein
MNRTPQISPINDASSKATHQPEIVKDRGTREQLSNQTDLLEESTPHMQPGLPNNPSRRLFGRIADQLRSSPQRHLSISIAQIPESDRASSDFEYSHSIFWNGLLNLLWRVFDNVVLLQMGSSYMIRFHELALVAEGGSDLASVDDWRKDQQAEWDRLSPTVRLKYPWPK